MKQSIIALLALGFSLVPTYALSFSSHPNKVQSKHVEYSRTGSTEESRDHKHDANCNHQGETTVVPEINAAGTAIALALICGLVLVVRERRKNQQS